MGTSADLPLPEVIREQQLPSKKILKKSQKDFNQINLLVPLLLIFNFH